MAVNNLLAEKSLAATSWQIGGISRSYYNCDLHTNLDDVQPTEETLSGIKSIQKTKISRIPVNAV